VEDAASAARSDSTASTPADTVGRYRRTRRDELLGDADLLEAIDGDVKRSLSPSK
jgi:hypothetical protein